MEQNSDKAPLPRLPAEPTLCEVFPSLAETHRHARDLAHAELAYCIDRRDKLTERIRFGLVALNGASLIALMSALGGSGEAARWLGFTPVISLWSAGAFTIGLMMAGYSAFAQQNLYVSEAGDAVERAGTYAMLASRYHLRATEENVQELGEAISRQEALPLVGFQYSVTSIWAQNFAGGAWFAGIAAPLLAALGVAL